MENTILLPKLNNPRLKELGKKQNTSRKRLTITNDKLKNNCIRLNYNLQRESAEQDYMHWQQAMVYKKSLVEHKGLQACLRRRRQQAHSSPTFQNGVYNGLKLEAMRPEIKRVIWEHHPRTRRMRQVEEAKRLWKQNGNLIDYNKSLQSLDAIIKRQKQTLPALRIDRSRTKSLTFANNNVQVIERKNFAVLPKIYTIKPIT